MLCSLFVLLLHQTNTTYYNSGTVSIENLMLLT